MRYQTFTEYSFCSTCLFSSYNKRINDIRECKEQALSHAYVHNLFTNPFIIFPVHHTREHFHTFWFISLPTFPVLFIYIPVLFFFPVSHLSPSFELCLQPLVFLSGNVTQQHYLPLIFIPHSSPPPLSPRLSHLCFILIIYSVFPFHLHSHSSAITVICLLLSSCRIVLKVSKYHLFMMLVRFDALLWLPLLACVSPPQPPFLQRVDAQRETQVSAISPEGAGNCFSWSAWTTRS